jgi:hypothetical protein
MDLELLSFINAAASLNIADDNANTDTLALLSDTLLSLKVRVSML